MVVLNTTELLAAAVETLVAANYKQADLNTVESWGNANSRLLEDAYCVVGITVYATWEELVAGWPDAQSHLIITMSDYLKNVEAKLWDGYLVLMTPGVPSGSDRDQLEKIRYDTNRLRKLVITGDDVNTVSDVQQALLSLLPIEPEEAHDFEASTLEMLPDLIGGPDIPAASVVTVVDAFIAQEPILDRLHRFLGSQQ